MWVAAAFAQVDSGRERTEVGSGGVTRAAPRRGGLAGGWGLRLERERVGGLWASAHWAHQLLSYSRRGPCDGLRRSDIVNFFHF